MFKKISIVYVILFTTCILSGPFGLEKGMKLDDIDKNPKKVTDGKYKVNVPKPHPLFKEYYVTLSPSKGLCIISAYTEAIYTNSYGEQLKNKFDSIENKLKDAYGKNLRYDFLSSGSIWNKSNEWMMGLLKQERYLTSFWTKKDGSKLINDLESIMLEAYATRGDTGYIKIVYSFSGYKACIDEIEKKQDDAL